MWIKDFYFKNYKLFLLIPAAMMIFSLFVISSTYNEIGDIVKKDTSLRGGVSLIVISDVDISGLEDYLRNKFDEDFDLRKLTEFGSDKQIGFVVEASDVDAGELEKNIEEKLDIELNQENLSVEITGSTLGNAFYRQMLKAILFAFLFMAAVVFITFRNFIPSLIVVTSVVFDMIVTIAIINLIGLEISTAGVAALLLLLGYSIDSDIVLNTRVLKRKEGTMEARILNSMKTGITMTLTTFTAVFVGYFISNSFVIKEMFLIIMIGLLVDVVVTWIFNTGVLRIYLERKGEAYG